MCCFYKSSCRLIDPLINSEDQKSTCEVKSIVVIQVGLTNDLVQLFLSDLQIQLRINRFEFILLNETVSIRVEKLKDLPQGLHLFFIRKVLYKEGKNGLLELGTLVVRLQVKEGRTDELDFNRDFFLKTLLDKRVPKTFFG